MTNNSQVFVLTEQESMLTETLAEVICEEIQANNNLIPFRRYMEFALYFPGLGYYSNSRQKFGAAGDFVTAPVLSQLFGIMLAKQIQQLLDFGVAPDIFEFGAGNGQLAADILSDIGDNLQSYFILELSSSLAELQRLTIAKVVPQYLDKVIWVTNLPLEFDGIMLANEVLDAQPCDLIRYRGGEIFSVGVTVRDNGSFAYCDYPLEQQLVSEVAQLDLSVTRDYLTELHLTNQAFINSLAGSIRRGAILLIDYGYGSNEYYHPQQMNGRLRGFFRHHILDEVLVYPGLIDITTSVNWSKIATAAIDNNLDLIGYATQSSFLLNCGLADRMAFLHSSLSSPEYLRLSNQVNQLISQNQMGELFKVMALSKNIEQADWLGFSTGDLSYSL